MFACKMSYIYSKVMLEPYTCMDSFPIHNVLCAGLYKCAARQSADYYPGFGCSYKDGMGL